MSTNLTFGTLEGDLRPFIQAATMQGANATFDDQLKRVSDMVVAMFERRTNRRFAYAVSEVEQFPADRMHFVLSRFPINISTDIVVEFSSQFNVWTTLQNVIQNFDPKSAVLWVKGYQGLFWDKMRFTYTGGYWLGAAPSATPTRQAGRVLLTTDAEEIDVAFTAAFGSAPVVTLNIEVPEGGAQILANPEAVTVDGFSARLGFPIPAGGGYYLSWVATAAGSEVMDPDMPVGATPVPDDLRAAWLVQCQALWQVRDALGVAIAGQGEQKNMLVSLSLPGFTIVPEVEAVLKKYERIYML